MRRNATMTARIPATGTNLVCSQGSRPIPTPSAAAPRIDRDEAVSIASTPPLSTVPATESGYMSVLSSTAGTVNAAAAQATHAAVTSDVRA